MKKLLLLIFVCFAVGAMAQDDAKPRHHFKIEDGKIIWQKVYDYTDSINVRDKLIESSILSNVVETNQKLVGQLNPFEIDYKSYGYSRMGIPIYLSQSDYSGNVSIESKNGKYRVTVTNIQLTQKFDNGLSKKGDKENYEFWAMKKNYEFRDIFLNNDAIIVENNFDKLFTLKTKKADNW